MQLRVLILAVNVLTLVYPHSALPNPPKKPTLAETAIGHKNSCLAQQGAVPAHCACIAAKVAGITDPTLAEKVVTHDSGALPFFKDVIRKCRADHVRESIRGACLEDAADQPRSAIDVEAACRCVEERTRKMDDQEIIDAAAATILNGEAREKDPGAELNKSKIEQVLDECEDLYRIQPNQSFPLQAYNRAS